MKFADFIKHHEEDITNEWVEFAQENISGVNELEPKEVRDHIKQMLDSIVANMEASQTDAQQEEKSKGNKVIPSGESKAANQHGLQRADVGFDIMELSSEFRALRASILRLWEANNKAENLETDFQDMIRFNESIDELWMISIKRFQHQVDESKNWFMGILGHDLRNPLAAISGVQSILKLSKNLSEKEKSLLGRSGSSVKRMTELINNLLELTNLRLGNGMTINTSPVDLSKQSEKIVQELQLGYPEAEIILESPGPVQGDWDIIRLDQLMTNLITNALRHGKPGGPVTVSISAKGNKAFFKVHNQGPLLPESIKEMISKGKFTKTNGDPNKKDSYGLGLYIIKQIVDGHKGEIEVKSNKKSGTTFIIILPRH
ncbi:sensor histidine kinase [Salegentibacter sp. JZCK2]|uniref:sensor histidine kinase n=1 Tax=Salegentibacter tibetensis TaxID=2873600 RepID=UPI001CCB2A7D|nr:sensor histidine kinase [Salegentibacter tibetensis]MBZ9730046.1 sensor histidine kinase [Salegentibacter tibetensis]